MSKHSLLSAQLGAIKAAGKDHARVDFRPVFTCVFLICLGRRREAPQVHTKPFHVWPGPGDDPLTWSQHLRTRRQITVLKDTLRDAQTGKQMGPGKKPCASFYSPPAIIQFDPLALGFCDAWKCCTRIRTVQRQVQTVTHAHTKNMKMIF